MTEQWIRVIGATEHNLKSLNCEFPRRSLVVVTGPSGSGKSSLVYDCIYKVTERRFLFPLFAPKSLSSKESLPKVESISGLSFASWVSGRLPRNTSATLASYLGIYDPLVKLFSLAGRLRCANCGGLALAKSLDDFVTRVLELAEGSKLEFLLAYGELSSAEILLLRGRLAKKGFLRLSIAEQIFNLDSLVFEEELHELFQGEERLETYLILDAFKLGSSSRERVYQVAEVARREDPGSKIRVRVKSATEPACDLLYADGFVCSGCGQLEPRVDATELRYELSSGSCQGCRGLGFKRGVICPTCKGSRLAERAERVFLGGRSFAQVFTSSSSELEPWVSPLFEELEDHPQQRFLKILANNIVERFSSLGGFGVDYLQLARSISSLSSGEKSRMQLARELAQGLSGVLFCVDEPSAGLHPLDCEKVLKGLRALLERGNSLLVIEHDPLIIAGADYLIELGPGSGERGGELMHQGPGGKPGLSQVYLGSATAVTEKRDDSHEILLQGVYKNNLAIEELRIPLGQLVGVCGVSGSGKSSLIVACLSAVLRRALLNAESGFQGNPLSSVDSEEFCLKAISGYQSIRQLVIPGGRGATRSSRSTVATLSGILSYLRPLYAATVDARVRGFESQYFSFNSERGWCTACRGRGVEELLSAVSEMTCEECGGERYSKPVLEVKLKGCSIAETLAQSIDELSESYKLIPGLSSLLTALQEVGLGYLRCNQAVPELSRGEKARLSLVADACRVKSWRDVLFILDEPSSGLGGAELALLMGLLRKMISSGASVIFIEHNTELLSQADYLIELGPGAGENGGRLIETGLPAHLAGSAGSKTGRFLFTSTA